MNIAQQLENDRKKLLQLDGHNPLLNYKSYKAKGVETTYPFMDRLLLHILSGKPVEFKESKETHAGAPGSPSSAQPQQATSQATAQQATSPQPTAQAPKNTLHWRAGNAAALS